MTPRGRPGARSRPGRPAVAALERSVTGRVLTGRAPGFEEARRSFVARFDGLVPRVVVQCAIASDVAAALAFAREHDLPVAIRSGGHCAAGRSSTSGVLIDLSPMRTITVAGGRATIGAGARLGDVYDTLLEHGATIPGGSCPTVGITGLVLGGGFGVLGRTHGLACDHLVAAEVVLADGRIVRCDDRHRPDLLWALRGAGGAQVAVVTAVELDLVPATAATNFRVGFDPDDAAAVVDAWQRWAPQAPRALSASLLIVDHGRLGEPPTVEVPGALLGSEQEADDLLAELVAQVGRPPRAVHRRWMSARDTRAFWAALDGGGGDRHQHRFHRSGYFRESIPLPAVTELIDHFRRTATPGRYQELDLTPWGGAYNDVPAAATAFAHRDELFLLKHTAEVGIGASPAERAAARRWADRSGAVVRRHGTGGIYPNFPTPDVDAWAPAHLGPNADRLRAVAAAYDPAGVFHR